jgi:hypothetical protein
MASRGEEVERPGGKFQTPSGYPRRTPEIVFGKRGIASWSSNVPANVGLLHWICIPGWIMSLFRTQICRTVQDYRIHQIPKSATAVGTSGTVANALTM